MSQKAKKIFFLVYGLVLSLLTAAAGAALGIQCVNIYKTGSFTPEKVAIAFGPIAPVIYLWCALVILGLLGKPFFALEKKHKPEKNYPLILQRLQNTTDLSACPEDLQTQILTLHRHRNWVLAAQMLLLVLGGGLVLRYAVDVSNFHLEHINESMVKAMTFMLPCMAVPFGFGVFALYFQRNCIQKEISLLKTAPAEAKRPAPLEMPKTQNLLWLKLTLLVFAILLMLCGYYLEGWKDVLTKAVNICTECVGLG